MLYVWLKAAVFYGQGEHAAVHRVRTLLQNSLRAR